MSFLVNPYMVTAGGGADGLLTFSGRNAVDGNGSGQTESYDLTSWTVENDIPKKLNGCNGNGTPTDALLCGGYNDTDATNYSDLAYSFDGTNWSSEASLNTGVRGNFGGGTSSSGLSFAGESSGVNYSSATEVFDSTSWSAGTSYSDTIRYGNGGGKTSEDQIGFCGNDSGVLTGASYRWDNVSWTSSGTVPYGNRNIGGDSNEDCSKALTAGGYTNDSYSATLDDTTWTQENDISTDRNFPSAMYLADDSLWCWGGLGTSWEDSGEFLDGSGGTWASASGTLNTAQGYGQGCAS